MLRDEVSRHYYYLQLKTNAVSRDQPKECADQAMLLLGGLALQADIGDVPTNTTGSNKNNISNTIATASDECCSSSSASAVPSTSSMPPAIAPRIPLADYFCVEDYIPHFMRSTWGSAAIQSCHREYRGMSSADAETQYIREACQLSDCINAHVFRMKQSKGDASPGHMLLIVYSKGIKVVPMDNGQDATTFLWPGITKLSFERKKFEIRSGEDRVTLYSLSDDKNKMLLALCRETHQFSMKIAPRLTEAIKRAAEQEEEEETSSIHTQYMYSRSLHLLPYNHKAKNDQRISVISSTSSNTTSGIISDRVHSEDELEIMINSPPVAPIAAPSTESLALAHLLDRPSVSRQTSCAGELLRESDLEGVPEKSIPEEKSPLKEGGKEMKRDDSCCSLPSTTPAEHVQVSPQSMHNQGSQSSSTCSTVVIATATAEDEDEDSMTENGNSRRQLSTSSSLELGYSHTAQNSSLSEAPSNCHNDTLEGDEDEDGNDMSGVYTLAHAAPPTETSGVYTMNSSEMTGQSSEIAESVSESHESSHYGCFQPMMERHGEDVDTASATGEQCNSNRDSVDGKFMPRLADVHRVDGEDAFRLRSDSTISAAGSFRGDGSDPTDKKHGLLSAEELTELIVGRGTYPNRKTVSDNLDCDCDYVTLPLPLEGDSYIQGHQDTAPTEEAFDDEGAAIMNSGGAVQSPPAPPAPPKRIDSASALRSNQIQEVAAVKPSPPPPPYNARHETTGLCGPPVKLPPPPTPLPVTTTTVSQESSVAVVEDVPVLPLRDPPPYPQQPQGIRYANTQTVAGGGVQSPVPATPLVQVPPPPASSTTTTTSLPEEAAARFIKTRPNINILKAHTSVVGEKPSFAAPTLPQHSSHLQQHSQHTQMIAVPSPTPSSNGCGGLQTITSTIGIPLMPYKIHTAHKSMSALHPNSYLDAKSAPRTCVLLPVIKPRQFLPPPPPTLPRQPPPPPPSAATHGLATVYTSQLARSQIELYQQQLYSDVDYVIYPLQDPAVSQQEYLDAKQGSIMAAMAAHSHNGGPGSHPPPYMAAAYHHQYPAAGKTHALYRSTPFLPIQMPLSARYASTQNLSDTYVQLPGTYSPMYSPSMASLCSSYCEPPPPLPPIRPHSMGPGNFSRSRSDDNILNSIETMPRMKRMPPPPPPKVMKTPAYEARKIHKPPIPTPMEEEEQQQQPRLVPPPVPAKTFLQANGIVASKSREALTGKAPVSSRSGQAPVTVGNGTVTAQQAVDIQLIRERSKNLDLPLIAALCNDRSLLKQTKAFVMPKHPQMGGGQPVLVNGSGGVAVFSSPGGGNIGSMGENLKGSLNNLVPIGNRSKYPVSGLGTLQLAKPKKSVASHRHPQDKLPPLPGHTTEAGLIKTSEGNNYVMDPIKHKSYNSQPGV